MNRKSPHRLTSVLKKKVDISNKESLKNVYTNILSSTTVFNIDNQCFFYFIIFSYVTLKT